jgi:hypothetical protein
MSIKVTVKNGKERKLNEGTRKSKEPLLANSNSPLFVWAWKRNHQNKKLENGLRWEYGARNLL